MTASIPGLMKTAVAAFLVPLGTIESGCGKHPAPFTWEASGVRVAELDLPLGADGVSFKVGECLLEGREGSGRSSRQFRDRMILTPEFTGRESPPYGYVVHGTSVERAGMIYFRLFGFTEGRSFRPEAR